MLVTCHPAEFAFSRLLGLFFSSFFFFPDYPNLGQKNKCLLAVEAGAGQVHSHSTEAPVLRIPRLAKFLVPNHSGSQSPYWVVVRNLVGITCKKKWFLLISLRILISTDEKKKILTVV